MTAVNPNTSSARLDTTAAGDLFLVAVRPDGDGASTVCGFCCGTLSDAGALTHDSMATHVPGGSLLCIHSVCVAAAQRRQGVATRCGVSVVLRCTRAFGVVLQTGWW